MFYNQDESIIDTLTSEDGKFRVSVISDFDPMKPDGECYGTVLWDYGWRRDSETVAERYKSTDDWESVYDRLWRALGDTEDVEMVLRGTSNICEDCETFIDVEGRDSEGSFHCGEDFAGEDYDHEPAYDFSSNPVVGFDTHDTRDGKFIAIVTLADLKVWGWESMDAYRAAQGDKDPSEHCLHDFVAWAEGDVYGIREEKLEDPYKVHKHITITDLNDTFVSEHNSVVVMDEDWTETECVWGYYGYEYAKQYAETLVRDYEGQQAA